MARKWAILWHALFSIGAGVLYFYFVLPRWPELMGDTSHTLGTALRIVTGALIGLAALPVVFIQLRTRKPELGTPQLALSIRTWSIVAHVLAGVLIIGTAISEIWLSLDTAGQYLFGIYGAAAAIAVLGFFAFYLSFIAELPPPPPRPIKAKKPKRRRLRRGKKGDEAEEAVEESEEAEEPEPEDAEETEATELRRSKPRCPTRKRPTCQSRLKRLSRNPNRRPRKSPQLTAPKRPQSAQNPNADCKTAARLARRHIGCGAGARGAASPWMNNERR